MALTLPVAVIIASTLLLTRKRCHLPAYGGDPTISWLWGAPSFVTRAPTLESLKDTHPEACQTAGTPSGHHVPYGFGKGQGFFSPAGGRLPVGFLVNVPTGLRVCPLHPLSTAAWAILPHLLWSVLSSSNPYMWN